MSRSAALLLMVLTLLGTACSTARVSARIGLYNPQQRLQDLAAQDAAKLTPAEQRTLKALQTAVPAASAARKAPSATSAATYAVKRLVANAPDPQAPQRFQDAIVRQLPDGLPPQRRAEVMTATALVAARSASQAELAYALARRDIAALVRSAILDGPAPTATGPSASAWMGIDAAVGRLQQAWHDLDHDFDAAVLQELGAAPRSGGVPASASAAAFSSSNAAIGAMAEAYLSTAARVRLQGCGPMGRAMRESVPPSPVQGRDLVLRPELISEEYTSPILAIAAADPEGWQAPALTWGQAAPGRGWQVGASRGSSPASLEVATDGKTEIAIVRDGPAAFSVYRVRNDPTVVMRHRLQAANSALGIAAAATRLLTGVAIPIPAGAIPGPGGTVTAPGEVPVMVMQPATDRRERLIELCSELSGRIDDLLKRQPQGPPRVLAIDPRTQSWLDEADAVFSAGIGGADER